MKDQLWHIHFTCSIFSFIMFKSSYHYVQYFLSLGASACVHLNKFEEAITWCDKGLAVSFTGMLPLKYLLCSSNQKT